MNEKLSLSELQLIIKDSLYLTLPDFYWVVAEISEMKENSAGHCYLELIEKLPDGSIVEWDGRQQHLRLDLQTRKMPGQR